MAEFLIFINEEYRRAFRAERVFRDKTNPLEIFNDDQLIKRYRFPRSILLDIINLCHDDLRRPTNRNSALPVYSQVLCALRFFAKGSFQIDSGDIENISQPCVSRAITSVTNILCQNSRVHIIFPNSDEELNRIKFGFFNRYQMPGTIGAVDETFISIKGPAGPVEPLYVSRKGGHAINVQLICDFDMIITDLVFKWPGATHDSFVWRNSGTRENFLQRPPSGWLLGDSGYPLEPWLLVPIQSSSNHQEESYNRTFKKARSKVENCIGLWKSVFRCIDRSGGVLQYKPEKVCRIITAYMRRRLRLQVDEDFIAPPDEQQQQPPPENDLALLTRANRIRNDLVENYFN